MMDRYDFGYGFHKSPIGVWVKYTDHLSVIADLRTELERLREEFPQIEGVIDEDRYPAEWMLQHERQRLHKRLDAALAAKGE